MDALAMGGCVRRVDAQQDVHTVPGPPGRLSRVDAAERALSAMITVCRMDKMHR